MSEYFYNDDLRRFENLNHTCPSIYDLGDFNVLIVLRDGTNLTDYLDIENPRDVLYISEDLSSRESLERYYYFGQVFERVYGGNSPVFVRHTENPLRNIRAMVVQGVSAKISSLNDMFNGIENLTTISGLETWDVSNVETMDSLFRECMNLKTIHGLADWDVGNVHDMTWAFNECRSLEDISDLSDWDVGNVKSVRGMFQYCYGLKDISPVKSWNLNPDCDTKNIFCDTKFASPFKSGVRELKMERSLGSSKIKPKLRCEKCGSSNLVFGGGEIICRDCRNLVKSHIELKCPDCGSNDIKYTRLHDLECRNCSRVILEEVYFDSIIR